MFSLHINRRSRNGKSITGYATDFEFDVDIELLIEAEAWSLGFSGGAPQGLSKVASRRIWAEIDASWADRN